MSFSDFKRSLGQTAPPTGLSPALTALWWAGKNDWNKAHEIVASEQAADCAWVHAYLHRVEGDLDNARYWYRQARREPTQGELAQGELAQEWDTIAAALARSEHS